MEPNTEMWLLCATAVVEGTAVTDMGIFLVSPGVAPSVWVPAALAARFPAETVTHHIVMPSEAVLDMQNAIVQGWFLIFGYAQVETHTPPQPFLLHVPAAYWLMGTDLHARSNSTPAAPLPLSASQHELILQLVEVYVPSASDVAVQVVTEASQVFLYMMSQHNADLPDVLFHGWATPLVTWYQEEAYRHRPVDVLTADDFHNSTFLN